MKYRKRDRSPEEQVPSAGGTGRSTTLGEHAGIIVSPHVKQYPHLVDPPERRNKADTTTQSVLSALDSFLQLRLPYLEKNPLHTRSTTTREPKYYDRHLEKALRLKKVVFIKGFFESLSKIYDDRVKQLEVCGKDISTSFPEFHVPSGDEVVDEKSLVAYLEKINMYFAQIASGPFFLSSWVSAFTFSTQAKDVESSAEAAADVYLSLNKNGHLLSSMDRSNFNLIHKYDLRNFLTYEYKNLGFGSETFSALRTQEGDFHWTTCQERSGRDDFSSRCSSQTHRTEGRLTVTGRPTGPDALVTVDIIKRSTDENVLDEEEERPTKRVRKDGKSAAGKKVQSILQQAWTSAVVQDASFIVISSGNEECIAIRHRETQRLLISPPIRPSDKTGPSYVKVYIGLFIVAYQDAVDRAQQLDSKRLSLYAQVLLRLRIDDRPALPNASSSGLFDTHRVAVQVLPPESYFLDLLTGSQYIDLRLHEEDLAITQYNSRTWILSREGNMIASLVPGLAGVSNNIVFLDVDRRFDKTSRIWRVYFGVACGTDNKTDYFEKPLVLKIARDEREVIDLKTEYEWYGRLKKAGVTSIVECYGIFSCQVNVHEQQYFLLLEDGGIPVSSRPRSNRPAHAKKHHNLYKEAVAAVHECNFTHTNVTPQHILMDVNRGKVTLISLKDCRMPAAAVVTSFKATDIRALGLSLGIVSEAHSPVNSASQGSKHRLTVEREGKGNKGRVGRRSGTLSAPFMLD